MSKATGESILLTGSSGFIGQNLQALLRPVFSCFEFAGDLCDVANTERQIKNIQPDIIVHLAARTEVEKSFYEPISFTQVNYIGTVNLIEACLHHCPGLRLFVFSSTMETYGWQPISDQIKNGETPETLPVFDERTQQNPSAPYAVAKLACEHYLFYAQRAFNFPYCILRQTNTYGRLDNDFFVVEQIVTQMLKKREINLGNPLPWRNFLHIDDLISLYQTILHQPEAAVGKVFCTGPANALSIEKLADLIAGKVGWRGKINWHTKPKRYGEIYYLNSTNRFAKSCLAWFPRISLSQGLDQTIRLWSQKEVA